MPNSGNFLQPQNPRDPVFQEGDFFGRAGLIRNVMWRLEQQESLNIVGGPKLGKTSLLLRLTWLLNSSSPSREKTDSAAVYFNLNDEADCARLASHSEYDHDIVILDNCDSLLDGSLLSLFDLPCVRKGSTIFSGERKWKEFVESGGVQRKVRPIPLAVFLEKEAQEVMAPSLSSEQKAWVLNYGGTHPFMLKVLQSEVLSRDPHVTLEEVLLHVKGSLVEFFERCASQLQETLELKIFNYLIEISKPINPRKIADHLRVETIKSAADNLCHLGLISRWIRDEEATLSAENRLFNEWYKKTFVTRPDKD